jgi:hypothetical protein
MRTRLVETSDNPAYSYSLFLFGIFLLTSSKKNYFMRVPSRSTVRPTRG